MHTCLKIWEGRTVKKNCSKHDLVKKENDNIQSPNGVLRMHHTAIVFTFASLKFKSVGGLVEWVEAGTSLSLPSKCRRTENETKPD